MRRPKLSRSASALLAAVLACAGAAGAMSFGGDPAAAAASQVETERLQGATRYETAIDIAVALLGDNSPESCFAGDAVGLAYAWRSPDAIVSGPYLGELCAPLLLVDLRVLPAVVRDVLEEDGLFDGDRCGDLLMTACGGRAAISEQVLQAAANVAELRPLLNISAPRRTTVVVITANEPIVGAEGGSAVEVEFRRAGLDPVVVIGDVTPGGTVVRVSVPGPFDTAASIGLLVGDQVLVRADQVTDLAGNGNFQTARTV